MLTSAWLQFCARQREEYTPEFDERIRQGLASNDNAYMRMQFSNDNEYSVSAGVQGLTGEVTIGSVAQGGGFRPGGRILSDMMAEQTMTLFALPLAPFHS